ncbi:MAG TPA: energy transducer TonB [Usitatibacteraceae bacterium]|nr:energy transducer TonB [Usitatibacteraceae bacterium]
MEYVLRKSTPAALGGRFAFVVLVHALAIYGLMNGLSRANFKLPMLLQAIEYVTIIESKPVARSRPVPQKSVAQPSVAPPVMPLEQPPVELAPSLPVLEASQPPAIGESANAAVSSEPASAGLSAACPNAQAIRSTMRYPVQARRDGIEGDVTVRFLVGADGAIRDIEIVSSTHREFNAAVLSAVRGFACRGQGREVSVEVPFVFRLR